MSCCSPSSGEPCCRVESVVSVDERGQMVLPKEVREKFHIHAGDKLALVSWGQGSEAISCIAFIKLDELNNMVKKMLGPIFKEALK